LSEKLRRTTHIIQRSHSSLIKFPKFIKNLVQRINPERRRHCPRLIRTLRFPLSLTQNVGTAEAAAQNPPYHMQTRWQQAKK